MLQVPLDAAFEFDVRLAKPIYGSAGQILLKAGAKLAPQYVSRLKSLGITSVFVEGGKVDTEEPVGINPRLRASAALKEISGNGGRCIPVDDIVNEILNDIMCMNGIIESMASISSYDGYTFAHSVDVCVLSMCIGKEMGYNKTSLIEMGVGALLHDVGKLKISPHIINRPGKITEEEFCIIKKHTEIGYELVKKHRRVCERSARMVIEHHERYNGDGYPNAKKTKEIDRFSSICAIADVYNAMTTNGTYRKVYPPHEVYEMILGMGDTHFEFKSVQAFSKCILPYPQGSVIELSDGRKAQVLKNNIGHPYLPVVILLENEEIMDLYEKRIITIKGLADPTQTGLLTK